MSADLHCIECGRRPEPASGWEVGICCGEILLLCPGCVAHHGTAAEALAALSSLAWLLSVSARRPT